MAIKDIHENFGEYSRLKKYRAFLYSPANELIRELDIFNATLSLKKDGYNLLDFSISPKIFDLGLLENSDNFDIDYTLDGYEVELWYGDLITQNYNKERFIIKNRPSSLHDKKPVYNYNAISSEYALQMVPIINWPGIEVMSYKQITTEYTSNQDGPYLIDVTLSHTPIDGTIIVTRTNTTYGVEFPLIKSDVLDPLNIAENEFAAYLDVSTNKVKVYVPQNTKLPIDDVGNVQWNEPEDTYQYYIYYETEDEVSSSEITEGVFEESPYYKTDGLTINEVIDDLFTNINPNFIEWTADTSHQIEDIRSGLSFSSTNVHDMLESLKQNYDVYLDYDTINRVVTIKDKHFGTNNGLRFEYGKYLKGVDQSYTTDEMINYIQGQDANSIGFADVSWSGDNYIENYDYYLDGAEWTPKDGLSQSSRWLSNNLALELAKIKYYQGQYQDEVWGENGIIEARYDKQQDIVDAEMAITELDAQIAIYDGLIENYNNLLDGTLEDKQTASNLDAASKETAYYIPVNGDDESPFVLGAPITVNSTNISDSEDINFGSTLTVGTFRVNGELSSSILTSNYFSITLNFKNSGSSVKTKTITGSGLGIPFSLGELIDADSVTITIVYERPSVSITASLTVSEIVVISPQELSWETFNQRQEYLKAIDVMKRNELELEISQLNFKSNITDFNPSQKITNASDYGIYQLEERLEYIRQFTSLDYAALETAGLMSELKRIRRGGVYQNNDIIDSKTLFKAAQDYLEEHKYPEITISISSVSLFHAEEAHDEWWKVRIGEKIDVYVPELRISVESEIQELTIGLDNYSMGIAISNVQNYDKTFGRYFSKTYKLLNTTYSDIIVPTQQPIQDTSSFVETNSSYIEKVIGTDSIKVGFTETTEPTGENSNSIITIEIFIDPETETLTSTPPVVNISGGGTYSIYGDNVTSSGYAELTNGGLYIKDENEKNVISLTSRNGLIGTNTDGDITFHLDMEGDAKFAGDVSGSTGTFGDVSDETNFVIKLGDTTSPLIISTTEATPNIMAQFDATGDFSLAGQNIVWDQSLETLSILGDLNLETFVQYTDVNYTSVNVSLDISNFIEVTIIDHPAIAEEDAPDTIGLKLNLASVNTTTKELTINITDLDDVSLGSITIGLTQYLNFDSYTITNETTHAISGWQFTIDDGGTKAGYSVNNIVNSVVTLSYHMKNDVNDILDYLLSHLGVSTSINADLLNGYSSGDFVLKEGDSMTGSLDIDGDLTITGDIIQQGAAYETHAEHIYTTQDKIYLRDGATTGLLAGETVGLIAVNADGSNNAELVFNGDGVARVGDSGSTQAIATREDTPTTSAIPYWNNTLNRLDSTDLVWDETNKRFGVVSPTSTFTVNNNSKFNYSLTVGGKTYLKDNLYLDANDFTDNSYSIIMSYNDSESIEQATGLYVDSSGDLRFNNGTANKVYHDGNLPAYPDTPDLSLGTTTGTGNAVTSISVDGHEITLNKGATFLTSFTESDPIFTGSAASRITATDITNWNAAEANVQADWNATSGDAFILNKPDLSNYLTTSTGKKSYTWEAPIVYNTFRNIAKSVGPDLSTGGILYAEGTSGSVVINARFEILVNHSQDIMINSISTGYTQCSLRIQSDSNENMNLLFTREHDDTNETTVRFTYIPYVDEVEFTPYDNNPSPSYSTIALTHTTKFFGTNISSTGGSASRKYIEGVEIAVTTDIPSVSGLLKIDGSNAMNDDLPIVAQGIEADSDSYGIEFRFVDSNIDPQAKTLYTASDGTLIFGIEDVAMIGDIPTNNNELTNGAGYTTNTGTVTEVTVGTGLDVSNGTTTPNITLDLSEFTDMTADVVGTEDEIILLDNGGERRKLISEIKLSQFNNDSGWTSAGVTGDAHALVSEGNPHSVTLSEVGFTGDSNANYITNNNELENGAGYITNTLSDEAGDDFTLGTNGTVSSANSNAVRFKYHATGTTTDTYKNLYVDNAGDLNFGSGIVALLSDIPSYTDTNTTYTHSWVDSGMNAILRLAAGGSGSGNDDLTIIAGDNITLTPSGDNLTIASANTTYDTFENLTDGLVPAPNEVGSTKFLRQDGTWVVPYTHPTEDGDDFSINTTNLTGSSVFSGITINVTTNTLGHVTDTNGTVSTRNIDAVRGQNGTDIKFWTGTSAEYQALGSYDSNTIYYVTFN